MLLASGPDEPVAARRRSCSRGIWAPKTAPLRQGRLFAGRKENNTFRRATKPSPIEWFRGPASLPYIQLFCAYPERKPMENWN